MVSRPVHRQNKANKIAGKSAGFVRIISGLWKGKKLPVFDSQGLRPTTDRVKETLFNWLMFSVHDCNVLDCYAGSGSLGFEALSRGAKKCTFIELSQPASKQLKTNLINLKQTEDTAQVFQHNCLDYLENCNEKFDLVFIDPPFRLNLVEKTCQLLTNKQLLNPNAYIYIETESELNQLALPDNWALMKEKTAGQVCYRLYQYLT